MILLLCGKTASGKTSIRDELVKLGYKSIITFTTRPIRDGEVNGVTYHYISTEEFIEKEANGFFAETTSYNVATGETWYYGTAKEDLVEDGVLIVNPDGLKAIKNMENIKTIAFLIMADENTLWNRLRQRGDLAEEARRRLNADEEDFRNVTDYVDFAVRNVDEDLADIADLIKHLSYWANRTNKI